jgi:hypothetical protein
MRNSLFLPAVAVLLLTCLTGAASIQAALLQVINPGFEDISGESQVNVFTFGPLNGWDLYEGPVVDTNGGDGPTYYIGTLAPTDGEFFPAAAEGSRVGIAFNFFGSGDGGEYGMVQTLTDTITANTLQANTQYTLEVEIGNIASGYDQSSTPNFYNLDGFPGYRVDLLAGGVVLSSDNNSLAGSIAEATFETSTVTFTTGASHAQLGQALGIRLVNLNEIDGDHPNADLEVDFDNVRLDATAIPEPTTVTLILLGLIGLFLTRRH